MTDSSWPRRWPQAWDGPSRDGKQPAVAWQSQGLLDAFTPAVGDQTTRPSISGEPGASSKGYDSSPQYNLPLSLLSSLSLLLP